MEIKVNNQINANLLHDYFWDLDEIAMTLENEHPELRDLEVVNVTEDLLVLTGYQDNSKVNIYITVEEIKIIPTKGE